MLTRSHQQIKLVMEKLVKENLSFIHMSIGTLSMTLVKENLFVSNRLYTHSLTHSDSPDDIVHYGLARKHKNYDK